MEVVHPRALRPGPGRRSRDAGGHCGVLPDDGRAVRKTQIAALKGSREAAIQTLLDPQNRAPQPWHDIARFAPVPVPQQHERVIVHDPALNHAAQNG